MPQKRKQTNKKKNKGGGGAKGKNNKKQPTMQGSVPTNWSELTRSSQDLRDSYDTIYKRYKEATKRFIDYMINECPEEVRGEIKPGGNFGSGVNALVVVAEWMSQTNHVMDHAIMKDLKLSIRMRSRVAKSVFGGGDSGHAHFLTVLVYCWTVLNRLPSTKSTSRRDGKADSAEKEDGHENRYAALVEDADEDDDEEDEEFFPLKPVQRPDLEKFEPLSLDELMKSDDRNDAILFLLTLDELMESVSIQYKAVLKNQRFYESLDAPTSAIIEIMLEAAVNTNMAIQQVQQLEMDLMVQHDHLTNPYRLLATLVLPEITQTVTATVREHATKPCSEKDAKIYLGDCLECYFRNASDRHNKKDTIIQEFCTKFEVDSVGTTALEKIFNALRNVVVLEVPIGPEKSEENLGWLRSLTGSSSRTWIHNMIYIGGDRAIHHTIRLLQAFGSVVEDTPAHRQLIPKRGFFGPSPWRPRSSRRITDDLDELLLSDILPQWFLMCRKGILGKTESLPLENELCALFVTMRKYIKNPSKPVSWSLAFAIHALLTSVLESDPVFDELLTTTKVVFHSFFDNVEWAHNLMKQESDAVESPAWNQNMFTVLFLQNLGLDVFGDHALWNPLCGGTMLSYLAYFVNLEAGCAIVDCHAQLRITLHLYNALLKTGILQRGQLLMLDQFYDSFKPSKAIWKGSPPQRGEFVQRFWMCFGSSAADAKRLAESAKQHIHACPSRKDDFRAATPNGRTGNMTPIEPAQLSKSYRRICNRDFHDVVDKYHTPEQRRRNKGTDQYLFAVRANDTLDAIDNEANLLSFNLPTCGALLEQFVCSLGRILQWDPLLVSGLNVLSAGTVENDRRQGFAYLFAQHLLGAMDYANDPFSYRFLNVPMGEASLHFMTTYFSRLDPAKAKWFQAMQEEE